MIKILALVAMFTIDGKKWYKGRTIRIKYSRLPGVRKHSKECVN